MQAEHLHLWIREATREKDTDDTNCRKVVVLVQA